MSNIYRLGGERVVPPACALDIKSAVQHGRDIAIKMMKDSVRELNGYIVAAEEDIIAYKNRIKDNEAHIAEAKVKVLGLETLVKQIESS